MPAMPPNVPQVGQGLWLPRVHASPPGEGLSIAEARGGVKRFVPASYCRELPGKVPVVCENDLPHLVDVRPRSSVAFEATYDIRRILRCRPQAFFPPNADISNSSDFFSADSPNDNRHMLYILSLRLDLI